MEKIRVGILFGGRSGEHEVSLLSAASGPNGIDKEKYEVVPIGITKNGRWRTAEHAQKHLTRKLVRAACTNDPKKVQKLVESKLIYPVFVKPANLGSSVGISKAHNRKELGPAIEEAAKFDRKIVIEQGVGGKKEKAREIECSVLGNDEPAASVPGEIVPGKEFYDYAAKYLDEGSQLIIPAKLSKARTEKVQEMAGPALQGGECSRPFRGGPFI